MNTFENIVVRGITYQKIIDIVVEHRIGQHALAIITLEMIENNFTQNQLAGNEIKIVSLGADKEEVIFCGLIHKNRHVKEPDYTAIQIEAQAFSCIFDRESVTATYQNSALLHQELMEQVLEKKAILYFGVTDSPLGKWQYRNNETAWEFLKRVASGCGACVFANLDTKVPVIYIGRTDKENVELIHESETYIEGFEIRYRTYEKVELGTKVTKSEYVNYLKIYFIKGTLVYEYSVSDINAFKQEVYYNQNSACKMIEGEVQDVNKEKVQVFFDTIDESYDTSGDNWFEYATTYASNGGVHGSSFYCMPEKGDRVKVFLPDANEENAFAFGSVSAGALESPENVKIANTFGKEILITDKEVRITCNGTNMYISMNKDGEICVWSDKPISFKSDANISIHGTESVNVYAPNRVKFKTVETSLTIDKEKIVMTGGKLNIN